MIQVQVAINNYGDQAILWSLPEGWYGLMCSDLAGPTPTDEEREGAKGPYPTQEEVEGALHSQILFDEKHMYENRR